MINQRFGLLKVIQKIAPYRLSNGELRQRHLCICDCGQFITAESRRLKHKQIKSCGCLRRPNWIGQKYGRLTIKKEVESKRLSTGKSQRIFECTCECGEKILSCISKLRNGNTTSCGCVHKEQLVNRNFKHGHSTRCNTTKTYHIWRGILERCCNPNSKTFKHYGGRGIKVCEGWQGEHGYENFLADMGECPSNMSIDRIDNDGNYEPGNCRWANRKQQANNKRTNIHIYYENKYITLEEFTNVNNLPYLKSYRLFRFKKLSAEQILAQLKPQSTECI